MEGVATARRSRLEGCSIFATKRHKKHKGFAHRFVPLCLFAGINRTTPAFDVCVRYGDVGIYFGRYSVDNRAV